MPASVINSMSAVPPELKKGSETPVGGTELVTTATLKGSDGDQRSNASYGHP